MNISNAYARAIFRIKFSGQFPAGYIWRLVFNVEQLPTADAVFTFTANDSLVALIGMRKAAEKEKVA